MGRNFVEFSVHRTRACAYNIPNLFSLFASIYLDGHAGRTFLALMKVDSLWA